MMKKITIHINILNDAIWRFVFSLFDLCHNKISTFNKEDFPMLIKMGADIRYYNDIRSIDDGETLTYDILCNELKQKTTFFISIVCKKDDDSANNPDIFPFILWLVGLKDVEKKKCISLGIDISDLDEMVKDRYKYRLGQKLQLVKDKLLSPTVSGKCLYYIDYDRKTGEKKACLFPYSKSDSKVHGSRRFLPFLPISETLYKSFTSEETKTDNYLEESINYLNHELKGVDARKIKSSSLFEDWFVKAYLCHLKENETKDSRQNYDNYKYILHEYYMNIYELVQNIIFHTEEKTGILSLDFVKKRDVKDDLKSKIPQFEKYSDDDRFLEFELCDNGNKGIVGKFKEENRLIDTTGITLRSFFDPQEILPDEEDQLTLRYVAHLGIKTFVSSVINNGGYFFVESNNEKGRKDRLETDFDKFSVRTDLDRISGTRYVVVLPLKNGGVQPIPIQFGNLGNDRANDPSSFTISSPKEIIVDSEESKCCQENFVKKIGDAIIGQIPKDNTNIRIDMSTFSYAAPNFIFKLVAYVRLNTPIQKQLRTIVCYNIDDKIFHQLETIVNNQNHAVSKKSGQSIWSDINATVLITNRLRVLILCGTNKDEFDYVNNRLGRFYTNESGNRGITEPQLSVEKQAKIREYIQYYDLPEAFINYVENEVLESSIEERNSNSGCIVRIPARLGDKIYIDEFFQADHLFLNSFFAERFAICIVREFFSQIKDIEKKGKLVLLGYHHYSKLLLGYVQNYLQKYCENHDCVFSIDGIYIGIDDKDSNEMTIENVSALPFSSNEVDLEAKQKGQLILVTIIPIASTLTTFDKLISSFKRKYTNYRFEFEYNHCSILIRDNNKPKEGGRGQTEIENEWGWIGVDEANRTIITKIVEERTIHYLVAKRTKWHRLIDPNTFPLDFTDEVYIDRTRNSSLNVKNLLNYPQMSIPPNKDYYGQISDYFKFTTNRLSEMKEFIYFVHIIHNGKHYRYYFDVPGYINKYQEVRDSQLRKWIGFLEKNINIRQNRINVIVTSEPDKDPQLSSYINKYLFSDSANVLVLDLKDRNIKFKHQNYRGLNKDMVDYYFVDQALLTGGSYYTAKQQLSEILNCPDFRFRGVFTIINRLSQYKYQEISNDLEKEEKFNGLDENRIFSFNHIFIPPCEQDSYGCYLCDLEKDLERLKNSSVITDCRNIIELNKKKYSKKELYDIKSENKERNAGKKKDSEFDADKRKNDRIYHRMLWQNRVLYEISNIGDDGKDNIETREFLIDKVLDNLLSEINKKGNNFDERISFIKALSSPPLSDYARIRKYAMTIMLKELKDVFIITGKGNPQLRNLILLKVLLKHLAMVDSNALVRKEVLVGSWNTYKRVREQLLYEIDDVRKSVRNMERLYTNQKAIYEDMQNEVNDIGQMQLFINDGDDEIQIKESKLRDQERLLMEIERNLDDKKNILQEISDYISYDSTKHDREFGKNQSNVFGDHVTNKNVIKRYIFIKDNKLNSFPKQLLYYIKIATHNDPSKSLWLGELLRTGEEMNVNTYSSTTSVSKTNMYNSLFKNESLGQDEFLLPHLFYDNTTIIRRTLDNFEKELRPLFKELEDEDGKMCVKDIKNLLWDRRGDRIEEFKKAVKEKYYYGWFRRFYPFENRKDYINQDSSMDGISFIEKYSLVLYARILLRHYAEPAKSDSLDSFDKNADHLLEVFSKIMNAQAAYISIKPIMGCGAIHTLSTYSDIPFADDEGIDYDNNFYGSMLLDNRRNGYEKVGVNRGRPFVMRVKLVGKENAPYGEQFDNKFKRAAYLQLYLPIEEEDGRVKDRVVGLVTFLFENEQKEEVDDTRLIDDRFLKEKQELGRLLLLLKPELDQYVKHVAKEKLFESWAMQKHMSNLTKASNHLLSLEKWDFENLSENEFPKIYNGIVMLSDVVVRHLYASMIDKHGDIRLDSAPILLTELFDAKYILLLKRIIKEKFPKYLKFDIKCPIEGKRVMGLLTVLRSYIIQLLINANKHADAWNISVVFYDDCFEILNDVKRPEAEKKIKIDSFRKKYSEEAMDLFVKSPDSKNRYGFTLISLFYYCKSVKMKCKMGFVDNDSNFSIKIFYPNF